MDNAQKAIMIGVGLFITIIIISMVLLITNIGTNLITNAQGQMSGISTSLQNQVTQAYDGKTMSASEVISACTNYQDSDSISIRIIVSPTKQFETGKYSVVIADSELDKLDGIVAGGIEVGPDGDAYADSSKDSLAEIQSTGGVSGTQRYYSYVMKDADTDTTMGILFVRIGADIDELTSGEMPA